MSMFSSKTQHTQKVPFYTAINNVAEKGLTQENSLYY